MATLDDEIDALYQGPADAFTSARNALVKRAGERASEVRQLARPNAAAWAINQVFWHRRRTFDALVKASEARRAAHVRQLRGDQTDVAESDRRHRAAIDAAFDAAVGFLKDAGDGLSGPTLDALTRTLEAVPADVIRGRLTRPVDAVGFSTLASLMAGAGGKSTTFTRPADVVVMPRRGATGKQAAEARADHTRGHDERRVAEAQARQAAEAIARERAALGRERSRALSAERKATGALTAARTAVEQAAARLDRLQAELETARRALDERREAVDRARLAVNDAAAARVALERRLQELAD